MENLSSLKILWIMLASFLLCNEAYSQVHQFRLFGFNPCNDKTEKIQFYELKKDNLKISPDDTLGICFLKEPGTYELVWVMANYTIEKDNPIKIVVDFSKRQHADTIRLETIMPCHEVSTGRPWSGFCNCGEPCEGYQVDYYKNGSKRIEGNFKQGKPIGKLIYYKKDGSINYVEKYNKKGKLKRTIN